jgi:hypothetical protein
MGDHLRLLGQKLDEVKAKAKKQERPEPGAISPAAAAVAPTPAASSAESAASSPEPTVKSPEPVTTS